ncbi:MAG: cytochrome d ubiquinol oxidase subunit II [Saprospiraceae bacterium]|jgi:cytochrome d ubiquinol oxidase subunit II
MVYTELVTIILGISLVLYTLLGGADFGAGIIELFTGDRGNEMISNAMAPVWEANHIWLIIALVILFNGFPEAYVVFSTALHIPVLIILVGIIFRGAAFTFRHYDAYKDESQKWYSAIFRYSSVLTVLFLGITAAALFSGTIPSSLEGATFYSYFIAPWANFFCLSVGVFLMTLSAYIAAAFLLGEVKTAEGYQLIQNFTKRLFVASVISGIFIFIASYFQNLAFHTTFLAHPVSVICGVMASVSVPLVFKMMNQKRIWPLRIIVGAQVLLIFSGWFILQWPDLIKFSDGTTLNIYEASSPEITMKVLLGALVFGVLSIFPSLYYLFRIFKK